MARTKQRKHGGEATLPRSSARPVGCLPFKDYLLLNALFSAACIVQLVLVRLLLRDFAGLYFFFIFLMVSFLVVSLLDYLSSRMDIGGQLEDSSVPVNEHT